MKLNLLAFSSILLSIFPIMGSVSFTSKDGNPSDSIRYKIHTNIRDPYLLGNLSSWLNSQDFDIAGTNWRTGEVEVITSKAGIDFLNAKGFIGLRTNSIPDFNFGVDARYLNPITVNQKIHDLAVKYPNLTRVEEIGKTLQGRPLLALLLSTTPSASDPKNLDKPSILFDGEHHAREVMTPEVVMDVADTLLKGYESDPKLTSFLQTWNVWLVPMVNPDGSNMVFSGKTMWRKNARGSVASPHGVDINRNYTYRWNTCSGSSGSTWAQDYRGSSSASEPETQALIRLAEAIRPSAYLSYHSYSELVLYPYGCTGSHTPEKAMVERIAQELAAQLPSDNGNGNYTAGSAWEILYGVDGDSMSHMYAAFGALSYTFEINNDFQPNYTLRDPTVLKHRKAWMYFLSRINKNILKIVVRDVKSNASPINATVAIDTISFNQGELPYRTNVAGRFFKVLDPGHYLVSARLSDGRTGQVSVDMAGLAQTVEININ